MKKSRPSNIEVCLDIIRSEINRIQHNACSKDTLSELNELLAWTENFANTEAGAEFNAERFSSASFAWHEIFKSLKIKAMKGGVYCGVNA